MPEDIAIAEAKLRKLGQRLHKAWAKEQPLTDEELGRVRKIVSEEWIQRQTVAPPSLPPAKPVETQAVQGRSRNQTRAKQEQEQQQQQRPQQQKRHGHGYSH